MRAVVYARYGSPDVLRIDDVPMPAPTDGQVLVKVAATSINLSDWECLRGSPLYLRLGGLRSPARRYSVRTSPAGSTRSARRYPVPSGDEVYGDNLVLKGGFAEYAVAPESALAHKPSALTFAEASTIPQAGGSRCKAPTARRPGARADQRRRRGSGSFAIQLANDSVRT